MKLIKKGDVLEKEYPIHRGDGRKIGKAKIWRGKHIADKNYILYEGRLFPLEINKEISIKFK